MPKKKRFFPNGKNCLSEVGTFAPRHPIGGVQENGIRPYVISNQPRSQNSVNVVAIWCYLDIFCLNIYVFYIKNHFCFQIRLLAGFSTTSRAFEVLQASGCFGSFQRWWPHALAPPQRHLHRRRTQKSPRLTLKIPNLIIYGVYIVYSQVQY